MWVKFSCFRGQEISSTNTRCNAAHSVGSMRCSDPLTCKLTQFISGRMSQFSTSLKATLLSQVQMQHWQRSFLQVQMGFCSVILNPTLCLRPADHVISIPYWRYNLTRWDSVSATTVNCERKNNLHTFQMSYLQILGVSFSVIIKNQALPFQMRPPVSFKYLLLHNYWFVSASKMCVEQQCCKEKVCKESVRVV